jgi:hypothetical protein
MPFGSLVGRVDDGVIYRFGHAMKDIDTRPKRPEKIRRYCGAARLRRAWGRFEHKKFAVPAASFLEGLGNAVGHLNSLLNQGDQFINLL